MQDVVIDCIKVLLCKQTPFRNISKYLQPIKITDPIGAKFRALMEENELEYEDSFKDGCIGAEYIHNIDASCDGAENLDIETDLYSKMREFCKKEDIYIFTISNADGIMGGQSVFFSMFAFITPEKISTYTTDLYDEVPDYLLESTMEKEDCDEDEARELIEDQGQGYWDALEFGVDEILESDAMKDVLDINNWIDPKEDMSGLTEEDAKAINDECVNDNKYAFEVGKYFFYLSGRALQSDVYSV